MNEYLVIIICHHGHADEVMQVARSSGATGGTILRARGSAGEEVEKFFNITIQPEKEIVLIILKENIKNEVMKAVSKEIGVTTPAHAISFAIKVDNTVGINFNYDNLFNTETTTTNNINNKEEESIG